MMPRITAAIAVIGALAVGGVGYLVGASQNRDAIAAGNVTKTTDAAPMGAATPVKMAEFSSDQRAEVEGIIRNYLIANPEIIRDAIMELQRRKDAATPRGVSVMCQFYADRATNSELWDVENRRFIDFASGIAVLNTGHRHPKLIAAMQAQLAKFTHTAYQIVPYEGYVELAERLNAITPGTHAKKTAFFTTGAEASITEMWRTLPLEPNSKVGLEDVSDGEPTSTVSAPPGRAKGPGS